MNKLETRTLIENSGNYMSWEIDDMMEVYDELEKHLGWEDKRRDKRFIVKFPDIFYYMDDEWQKEHEKEFDYMFEDFCDIQYENVRDAIYDKHWTIENILHHIPCGHYPQFKIKMENITTDNIAELTMAFHDEYEYSAETCVKQQIFMVDLLKELEDNYMDYWFEYLKEEDIPKEIVEKMQKKYKEDQEKKEKK